MGIHAQSIPQSDLREFHPQLLGAGGAYSGVRSGLPVLFTNPALFSEIPSTVTYFSVTSWFHSDIVDLFPALTQLIHGDINADTSGNGIAPLLERGGLGIGSLIVGGVYGGNFAAAFSFASDFFFYGNSYPTEIFGSITNDVRLSLALAYPVEVENFRFSIGFTIEPFYRISTFFSPQESLQFFQNLVREPAAGGVDYLNAENTFYGSGLSVHAGILFVVFDQFTIQATMRDIGNTRIFYSRTTLQNLLDDISNFSLPTAAQIGEEGFVSDLNFILPYKVRVGVAYHPTFKTDILIEPIFSLEFTEFTFTMQNNPDFNILHAMNFGAQITLDERFIVQTGVSQGQFTLGAGFDLGIFEIHTAWFGTVRALQEKYTTSHGLIISLQANNLFGN